MGTDCSQHGLSFINKGNIAKQVIKIFKQTTSNPRFSRLFLVFYIQADRYQVY